MVIAFVIFRLAESTLLTTQRTELNSRLLLQTYAALDCRETPAAAVENANTTGELGARENSGFISGLVETLSCETPVFSQLKRLRGGYETDLTGLMEAAAPSGLKRKTGFQHVVDVNVCTQVKDLL